jgi:hypothetical protein
VVETRPRAKKLGLTGSALERREEDGFKRGDSEKAGLLGCGIKSMRRVLGECAVWCAIDNSAARGKGLLIKPTSNHPALHTAQYANLR